MYFTRITYNKFNKGLNTTIVHSHVLKKTGNLKKIESFKNIEQDINKSVVKVSVNQNYFNNKNVLKIFNKYVIENNIANIDFYKLSEQEQIKFYNISKNLLDSHIIIYFVGIYAVYKVYITHFTKGIFFYEKDLNQMDKISLTITDDITPVEIYDKKELINIKANYDFDTCLQKINNSKLMLKGLQKFKIKHNLKNESDLKKKLIKAFFLNIREMMIFFLVMIKNGIYNKYNI